MVPQSHTRVEFYLQGFVPNLALLSKQAAGRHPGMLTSAPPVW